jgi:hypothetical protein
MGEETRKLTYFFLKFFCGFSIRRGRQPWLHDDYAGVSMWPSAGGVRMSALIEY